MTWVLIIFTGVYYGNTVAAIPGYSSKEECELAAVAYADAAKSRVFVPDRARAFCIQGPKR